MILKVFSVRDMKAEAFLQPFFSNSIGSALRAFGDAANDVSCPFNKHPSDYVLYEIGEYDDSDGSLEAISPVKYLGTGSDFVALKPVVANYDAECLAPASVGREEAIKNSKK